jgi:predicted aldo/keto reductase-like oxidoreductase
MISGIVTPKGCVLLSMFPREVSMIATQPFGATGHISTRIIFGAAALSNVSQADADRTMELIMAHGINHIDTAASYGDSEIRLGPSMKHHRNQFFLATKTGDRDYQSAFDSIQRSLERMQTDRIDLIQLHNLVDPQEWQTAMGPGGALEAAIEARRQGLVRFIGVTGHGLTVARQHYRALQQFNFDAVLLPYSYILMKNAQYAADLSRLAEHCGQHNVAMQTIKAITRAPWGDSARTAATWYAPLTSQEDVDLAVHWVLGTRPVFLNTVGDIQLLPTVLRAAEHFKQAPGTEAMDSLLAERQMAPLFVE